jgi:hypothetical protein
MSFASLFMLMIKSSSWASRRDRTYLEEDIRVAAVVFVSEAKTLDLTVDYRTNSSHFSLRRMPPNLPRGMGIFGSAKVPSFSTLSSHAAEVLPWRSMSSRM